MFMTREAAFCREEGNQRKGHASQGQTWNNGVDIPQGGLDDGEPQKDKNANENRAYGSCGVGFAPVEAKNNWPEEDSFQPAEGKKIYPNEQVRG